MHGRDLIIFVLTVRNLLVADFDWKTYLTSSMHSLVGVQNSGDVWEPSFCSASFDNQLECIIGIGTHTLACNQNRGNVSFNGRAGCGASLPLGALAERIALGLHVRCTERLRLGRDFEVGRMLRCFV